MAARQSRVAKSAGPHRVRTSPSTAHQPRENSLGVLLAASWFAVIIIYAPDLERQQSSVTSHADLWAQSTKAYDRYHCLARPTGPCCSPAHRDVGPAIVSEEIGTAPSNDSLAGNGRERSILGSSCARVAGGGGGGSSRGGRGGGNGGGSDSGPFICSCSKEFDTDAKLRNHQIRTRHETAQCEPCDEPGETEAEAEAHAEAHAEANAEAKAERAVDDIGEAWLDTCTELRYEHYQSGATVQRVKDAQRAITSAQTAAVKSAVAQHMKPGVNLDALIDPIMEATDRYRTLTTSPRAGPACERERVRVCASCSCTVRRTQVSHKEARGVRSQSAAAVPRPARQAIPWYTSRCIRQRRWRDGDATRGALCL
jgi:hypothetical protein